jgi:manganese transport protein
MIALVIFTSNTEVMGRFVNSRLTLIIAVVASAVVLLLNLVLIAQALGVAIPGLS